MHTTTTPAAQASAYNFEQAFDSLEIGIIDVAKKAKVADWLAGQAADHEANNGFIHMTEEELEVLTLTVFEVVDSAKRLADRCLEHRNAAIVMENEAIARAAA